MRREQFITWMQAVRVGGRPVDRTIKGYANELRTIGNVENLNLDDEFLNDELASLLQRYTYGINDARANRPDPTNLGRPIGALAVALPSYKTSINHYRRFCIANNPNRD